MAVRLERDPTDPTLICFRLLGCCRKRNHVFHVMAGYNMDKMSPKEVERVQTETVCHH